MADYTVENGEISDGAILAEDFMQVVSGGTANTPTVNSDGRLEVVSGGIANSAVINEGGKLEVVSDGIANSATVNAGGSMTISGGGTANTPTVNSDGRLEVVSGGIANSAVINEGGKLEVVSDGIANSATVNAGGSMTISGGGTANTPILSSGGSLEVLSGGTANTTVISGGGRLDVLSDGVVNSAIVFSDGRLEAVSGAMTTSAILIGGSFSLSGGVAKDTILFGGSSYVSGGGMAPLITFFGGKFTVFDGGHASGAVIREGSLMVSSGGTASEIVENGGLFQVSEGGVASSATVNGGRFAILSGGTADDVDVKRGGRVVVSGGGTATIVENGGYVQIEDGAEVSFAENKFTALKLTDLATIHSMTSAVGIAVGVGGNLFVSGGAADDVDVLSGGILFVSNGGRIGGRVTIQNGAFLSAYSGAILDFGSTQVSSGAVVRRDVHAAVYGELNMEKGAVLCGKAAFSGDAAVRIDGTITFDPARCTKAPQIIGFSVIGGAPDFTLTAAEKAGIYLLADDASAFDGSLKFADTMLAVGASIQSGDFTYLLDIAGDTLYLKVADHSLAPDNGAEQTPWNNFLYDRGQGGFNPNLDDFVSTPLGYGITDILLDRFDSVKHADESGGTYDNFVGDGDEWDFAKIHLENGAKLSFLISSTDAVKFTLYKLNEDPGKKNPVKSLQATTLKAGEKEKRSKQILLEAGDYYVSMQAKSSAAFYNVAIVGTDDALAPSCFYKDVDDGGNDWLWNKADGWNSLLYGDGENVNKYKFDENTGRIENAVVQIDDIMLDQGEKHYTNFVGFGDTADVRAIQLDHSAKLNFTIDAEAGAKILVYKEAQGKSAVAVSAVAVKGGSKSVKTTSTKVLAAGTYYICVQSTTAKKGGAAYYSVTVNGEIYKDGDSNTNDYNSKGKTVSDAVRNATALTLDPNAENGLLRLDGMLDGDQKINESGYRNFVGTGDVSDVAKIDATVGSTVRFKVTATDAVTFTIYGLQKNGKLKSLKTLKLKKNTTAGGTVTYTFREKDGSEFYIGVTSANAKKGCSAYYNVRVLPEEISTGESRSSAVSSAALNMPEISSGLDGLDAFAASERSIGLTDGLNPGQTSADVLAMESSCFADAALADGCSAWQNIASLA